MKFGLKVVIIGLTLVGFIGCGGDDEVAKKNVEASSLNGDWVENCDFEAGDTTSEQISLKFQDGKLDVRFVEFSVMG